MYKSLLSISLGYPSVLSSFLVTAGCHGFNLFGEKNGTSTFITKAESSEIIEDVKKQLWLAGPLISVNVLHFCLQLISVMFVGHLGKFSLSSASLATSLASVTGFSLLMGMGSALDTLCGQSYGAKQYHILGIHMQRAMLVLSLVSIPLAFVWENIGPIILVVGQDPEISFQAGVYARIMIPSIFAYGLLQCEVRFFQIWDAYNVKAQTFKTAIEAACILLRIDDIVSGIKKKQLS